jgi:hypothetical protein
MPTEPSPTSTIPTTIETTITWRKAADELPELPKPPKKSQGDDYCDHQSEELLFTDGKNVWAGFFARTYQKEKGKWEKAFESFIGFTDMIDGDKETFQVTENTYWAPMPKLPEAITSAFVPKVIKF